MKIKIICVGKTKKKWLQQGEKEYIAKLRKYAHLEWVVIDQENSGISSQIIAKESEKIIAKLNDQYINILLDVSGQELGSVEFANLIKNAEIKGKICVIIGGSHGVTDELKNKVDYKISFSKMTFVHEMIRVFLLEQIFRGCEINKGGEYHK